jgi:type IV pilus assembly protein PilM
VSPRDLLRRLGTAPAAMPIGVDFAAERLNMVQLERADGGMKVRAAVSVAYPLPREQMMAEQGRLRAFVKSCLAAAPFRGRRVFCALAPSEVRILQLTVAVAPGQREDQAVANVARDQLGMAPADAVVDYTHIRSADADASERQVLVAVAERARVMAFLDVLTGAGLDPVALDIGPAAMARLLARMQGEDLGQAVLLINFGVRKSYLTVTWGRRLMLDREIDFGEMQLADKLSSSLGLNTEAALGLLRRHGVGARPAHARADGPDVGRTVREILYPEFAALAEELVRTQVYVASRTRGSALSRVYLNGSLAGHPDILGRIAELAGLPVELLQPMATFAGVGAPPSLDTHPGIALAVGLALRGQSHVGN